MSVRLLAITPDALSLVSHAARTCYASTDRATPESDARLVASCIRRGHESVLEHASVTVEIECSRVVSHELVRQRIAAYSQRSQRYVKESEPNYFTPPEIEAHQPAWAVYIDAMENAWSAYADLLSRRVPCQIARYVLPNACLTTLVATWNLREVRHILRLRTAPDCQPEMQEIARGILAVVREAAPWAVEDVEC
jgi:thymidylate synthase (FAD)